MATPAASDWYSFSVSTLSGSFTHRKIPPLGVFNSADVPNCSSSFHQGVELGAQAASASAHARREMRRAIFREHHLLSAPEPASVFSASIRDNAA
jgi:hypothetical protein